MFGSRGDGSAGERWQQKAVNREEWESVAKKAKQGSQSAVEPRSE